LPLAIIFRAIGAAHVVGEPNLAEAKRAFTENFVQRPEFLAKYNSQSTGDSFVDALVASARAAGSELDALRDNLIASYETGGSLAQSRAAVLLVLSDNTTIRQTNYNSAFVLTEYFGYLQRDPERAGSDYWLKRSEQKRSWQLPWNGVRVHYLRRVSETIQSGRHPLERRMRPLTIAATLHRWHP